MFSKALQSTILPWIPWILLLLICGSVSERMWDFEIVSASSYSANESKLNISISVQQITRQEISVSAVLDWRFEADENTMIEGKSFSGYSGHEADYKLMPYKINKMKLFEFFDSFYNSLIYTNVGNCSNFPDYTNGFEPPLRQDAYKLENCLFTGDGVPEFLLPGYYRIMFIFSGQVDASITLNFKVMNKI